MGNHTLTEHNATCGAGSDRAVVYRRDGVQDSESVSRGGTARRRPRGQCAPGPRHRRLRLRGASPGDRRRPWSRPSSVGQIWDAPAHLARADVAASIARTRR
jgi:hypothetical protein